MLKKLKLGTIIINDKITNGKGTEYYLVMIHKDKHVACNLRTGTVITPNLVSAENGWSLLTINNLFLQVQEILQQ